MEDRLPKTPILQWLLGRRAVSERDVRDFRLSALRRLDNNSLFELAAHTDDEHLHGRLCQLEIKRRSDTRATIALVLSIIALLLTVIGWFVDRANEFQPEQSSATSVHGSHAGRATTGDRVHQPR